MGLKSFEVPNDEGDVANTFDCHFAVSLRLRFPFAANAMVLSRAATLGVSYS
jgi:hypothetical protein